MPSDEQLDESSQPIHLIIWLKPDPGVTVPVDSVCAQLVTEVPGTIITAENSFAAKRLSLEECRRHSQERFRQGTLEPWAWKTMDELNAAFDHGIARNRRVELRSGPQKDLAIPLSNSTQLQGHVGARSILFLGRCRRSDATVAKLVRSLESLHIGKVELLDRQSEMGTS